MWIVCWEICGTRDWRPFQSRVEVIGFLESIWAVTNGFNGVHVFSTDSEVDISSLRV